MPGSRITVIEKADFGKCLTIRQICRSFLSPKLRYCGSIFVTACTNVYTEQVGSNGIASTSDKFKINTCKHETMGCEHLVQSIGCVQHFVLKIKVMS